MECTVEASKEGDGRSREEDRGDKITITKLLLDLCTDLLGTRRPQHTHNRLNPTSALNTSVKYIAIHLTNRPVYQ